MLSIVMLCVRFCLLLSLESWHQTKCFTCRLTSKNYITKDRCYIHKRTSLLRHKQMFYREDSREDHFTCSIYFGRKTICSTDFRPTQCFIDWHLVEKFLLIVTVLAKCQSAKCFLTISRGAHRHQRKTDWIQLCTVCPDCRKKVVSVASANIIEQHIFDTNAG
jgi:hypothetical protein